MRLSLLQIHHTLHKTLANDAAEVSDTEEFRLNPDSRRRAIAIASISVAGLSSLPSGLIRFLTLYFNFFQCFTAIFLTLSIWAVTSGQFTFLNFAAGQQTTLWKRLPVEPLIAADKPVTSSAYKQGNHSLAY